MLWENARCMYYKQKATNNTTASEGHGPLNNLVHYHPAIRIDIPGREMAMGPIIMDTVSSSSKKYE